MNGIHRYASRAIYFGLALSLMDAGTGLALGERGDGTLGILGERDPRVLYSVRIDEKVVALTIDDGPDADATPELLATLEANGARATFFVVEDRIAGNEALMEQMVAAGHELGNHMMHDEPSIELTPEEFERRLLHSGEALARFDKVSWFRPASGYYDDPMLDILERHGLRCALGSVYPVDAHIPWSWFARTWIRWRARPGAVIILHDGGKRGMRTAKTLRVVLPALREKGYRIVTLSELAALAERERGER